MTLNWYLKSRATLFKLTFKALQKNLKKNENQTACLLTRDVKGFLKCATVRL